MPNAFPIVIIALVFGLIAIIISVLVIKSNISKQRKAKNERVEATVLRTESNTRMVSSSGASTVDSGSGYEKTEYFIEFKLITGERKRFKVKKKEFLSLHDGDQGYLLWKGYKYLGFEPKSQVEGTNFLQKEEMYFFQKSSKTGPVFTFYGELTSQKISLFSDNQMEVDESEVKTIWKKMIGNKKDSFIVITNGKQEYLELSFTVSNQKAEVYYTNDIGRYGIEDVKNIQVLEIIHQFYISEDLILLNQMKKTD